MPLPVALAALLAAASVLAAPHARARSLRRLDTARAAPRAAPVGARVPAWAWRPVAGAALAAIVGGRGGGATVLAVVALALALPARRAARRGAAERAALRHDVPRAAELLAVCVEAGSTVPAGLLAVADVLPGPLAARLRPVAAHLRSGGELPGLAGAPPVDDPAERLVRGLARAARTGAPLAQTVRDLANDERENARWAASDRARRAGVRAVGPLAACFLPAFVLVGVVPLVVGVAGRVLGELS